MEDDLLLRHSLQKAPLDQLRNLVLVGLQVQTGGFKWSGTLKERNRERICVPFYHMRRLEVLKFRQGSIRPQEEPSAIPSDLPSSYLTG